MSKVASQITSLTIVYSTVYSGPDQTKHQSSASLAFVRGIHRGPVNSPHKWPITRKMFPFDDVIMDVEENGCIKYYRNIVCRKGITKINCKDKCNAVRKMAFSTTINFIGKTFYIMFWCNGFELYLNSSNGKFDSNIKMILGLFINECITVANMDERHRLTNSMLISIS